MRRTSRLHPALAMFALLTLTVAPARPARAVASHVVISEVASRGPAGATDEFVEIYNPTSSSLDLSGWKLQYKSQTGASFSDYTILPAGSSIAAHGFYLFANS